MIFQKFLKRCFHIVLSTFVKLKNISVTDTIIFVSLKGHSQEKGCQLSMSGMASNMYC
jgi:hypothetical protein